MPKKNLKKVAEKRFSDKSTFNDLQKNAAEELKTLQRFVKKILNRLEKTHKKTNNSGTKLLSFSDSLPKELKTMNELILEAWMQMKAFLKAAEHETGESFVTKSMTNFITLVENLIQDLSHMIEQIKPHTYKTETQKSQKFLNHLEEGLVHIKEKRMAEQNQLRWSPF